MKKKLILTLAAVAAIAVGVVGMSAFEAHVINVTARIENALSVIPDEIRFGTVFPQEQLDREVAIELSGSFMQEERADDVEYVIKQKPKCMLKDDVAGTDLPLYGRVKHNSDTQEFYCEDGEMYEIMNLLCPYLSKHDLEPADQNDESIDAFHGPITVGPNGWTNETTDMYAVAGRLAKSQEDYSDLWNIDLKVPCFEGHCAQDWRAYVTGINPEADPMAYVQPMENEHEMFGCDLWIEVTGVSRRIEPEKAIMSLENKMQEGEEEWYVQDDNTYGTLEYNVCGTPFDFNLEATGLAVGTSYSLIYYADGWPGNHPGAEIWTGMTDASGDISVSADYTFGFDLPHPDDDNYGSGAKIWLIPSSAYDAGSNSVTTWPYDTSWLFEYNTITYQESCLSAVAQLN